MTTSFRFYVGVDLGAEEHEVVVVGADGRKVDSRRFRHDGGAVVDLFSWLTKITSEAEPAGVAIAAETPRGSIVEYGLERGHPVFSINPKQLDRFRDRFSVAGAKDDHRDALALASSLRTDQHCFRRLQLGDPRLLLLRELSRTEDMLKRDLRRNCNQLWSLLQRYFPALLELNTAADEPWLWSLLHKAPLPAQAARLKPSQLQNILSQHRIRRFSSADLADLLRRPSLPLAQGAAEALAESVLLLLPHLHLLQQQLDRLAFRIDSILDELEHDPSFAEHRDIEILRSVPGLGRVFIATVLAEAFAPLVERDYHALRALGAVAPITRQSGKTTLICIRRARNHRLHNALFHSANVFARFDPRAKQQYHLLRQKRNTHARALRGVGDRMLELVIVLLNNNTCYDLKLRQASIPSEGTAPQKTP